MEQRTKIRRNLLYWLDHPLQQTLKQNTKPSKKDTKTYTQAHTQEEGERERKGTLGVWGERVSEREFKYSPSNFPRNQTLQFINKT